MPCYANTMYITSRYREFGGTERRMLWDAYRAALDSDDDRLADPIAYSLWVDYFEDAPRIAKQAWQEVTHAPSDTRLRRALAVAGPVPWKVKAPLLESLLDSLEWHRGVLHALEGSAFDVCGDVEPRTALAWLDRLRLPPADLARVRERLSSAGRSGG
jgi:hypothetical protein